MFNSISLPRIAVVYANSKDAAGAVIHPTANTRFWKSYEAVAKDICNALISLGFDTVTMPDGADLVTRLANERIELVWLNTGGVQGECPLAQTPAVLETAGIPYVGHTPLNAALLDDKGMFKLACTGLGLPTAPFLVHNPALGAFKPERSAAFKRTFGAYQGPFIVKPINGRASQNVEFVQTVGELPDMVSTIGRKTNTLVMVEKFLGGREFCIAVMGAGPAGAFAFSPVERHLESDEKVFTSMDVKAITTDRVRAMCPDREAELISRLQALGTAVYSSLNLTSLVRLDIRADEEGELYILEANPKPDLKRPSATSTSLVCTGLASQLGWSYEDLIACCLVERLWQLDQAKPHMLAHFMPPGTSIEHFLQRLPERVAQILEPSTACALSTAPSLQEQESLKALRAFAASFSGVNSLQGCDSGLVALAGLRSVGSCSAGAAKSFVEAGRAVPGTAMPVPTTPLVAQN